MQWLASEEIRFSYTLLLNVAVFASALRFVRRLGVSDLMQSALDAFLLHYLIQYGIVGLLGVAGVLSPWSVSLLAVAVCIVLWASPRGRASADAPDAPAERPFGEQLLAGGAFLFVVGYSFASVWALRHAPVLSNDAMAYQMPAAVQWLRTGRLGLFEAWFYNPANVYSPLAGSTFITWLVAPMRGDPVAGFVQWPALLFLYFAVVQICRKLGVRLGVASLVAATAMLSRSFVSQAVLPKDDLFLAAFFAAGVLGLCAPAGDRLGPWRAGIGLGLFLATKYTALFSVPLLLMVIDAPFRGGWRWRQWGIVAGCVLLLAGPWYVRNAILTGNPLYPADVKVLGVTVFDGLLSMERSAQLRGAREVWRTFTGGYYSQPRAIAVLMIVAWAVAAASCGRRLVREPLARLCVAGSAAGLVIFVFASPYAEIRFTYPSLVLLSGCLGLALSLRRIPEWVRIALGLGCVATAAWSAFPPKVMSLLLAVGTACAIAAVVAMGLRRWGLWFHTIGQNLATAGAAVLVLAMLGYVWWPGYAQARQESALEFWWHSYGEICWVWDFANRNLPADATVAYTNTFLAYPLYGPHFTRRLVYAPARPGLERSTQLPHFPRPVTGEEIAGIVPRLTYEGADRQTWLANLRASGARYLLVGLRNLGDPAKRFDPPELDYLREEPQRFRRIDTPLPAEGRLSTSAALYEIVW